ncbi:hypothetical protein ACUL41_16745 [Virgibacillus natechei]|uniref:hypothetical protein n=1 Tax=Virgibacillus sp. CBA3643 TaxID=2942278 RepID=UPI0035A2D67D
MKTLLYRLIEVRLAEIFTLMVYKNPQKEEWLEEMDEELIFYITPWQISIQMLGCL